ncbi:hypothetical protein EJ04DRAFT_570980 [Polyplosphaeria fusca]|uniref:Only prolin and serin are matching in the corresponding protein n=1 Tax=Polyplosphaeria fusca TaxID=682080 RepID=A0A9P4QKZ0_9PLEO|nr:hypothetical protein EJ04DRAFT_570980 [Polyplosphaeria fusca]
MRDLKPLRLPALVAERNSSRTSLTMAHEPTSSIHSTADSGFYSASECSTPPTPSLPSRGHLRYPSSNSSLSSSPPNHEPIEALSASGKLPKLTEEPVEREDDYVTGSYRCSCDEGFCEHNRLPTRRSIFGACDLAEDYFNAELESHMAKRRRSVESTAQSLTNKIERRFPSITRKVRARQRSSTLARTSRSATPSRVSSTRSSSITSSIHHSFDITDKFPPTPAQCSSEQLDESTASSPMDVAKTNALEADADPVDPERFATTPLLPPLLVKTRLDDLPAQSPLQSPTIADTTHSLVATPVGTPPVRAAYPTPPLSSKPSVSSFKLSRPGHLVPSNDIPPIMLADPNDKWAIKLGHANFTIQPEPYVPDNCNTASLRQLFADWEQARCNYTKHQVRTGEHFGVTSKTYLLTEQKWAEIDAEWKANHDLAVSRATEIGEEPEPTSPLEPAPLSKMPTLNDPRSDGKFPKLGDEDIVGPMVQIASQIHQKVPSPRKRAFLQFFRDLKFPGSLLGKSAAGIRTAK